MRPFYIYLAIGVWTVIGVIIAGFARRRLGKGIIEFYIGGRRTGGFVSAMTYAATTFSAFMMVGLVGLVYSGGVAAAGFEFVYILSTVVLLLIFGPRFWVAGQKYGYSTPPELLSGRYDSQKVGAVAAGLALVMLIPYASAQLMGIGFLVEGLTGGEIPYIAGVLIMAAFGGVAALTAGFKSVAWTDAFQGITMLVTCLVLLFFVFYHFYGGPIEFFTAIEAESSELLRINWSIHRFIGMTLPWAFFAISNPQVSQRMFVSENIRSIKIMIVGFSLFALVYTVMTTLFGFSIFNLVESGIIPAFASADEAMPSLLGHVPTVLGLVTFTGIFAAATSTLGSVILTLSSLGTEDILKSVKPEMSESRRVNIGRGIIVIILLICILFAQGRFDLIAVLSAMASGGLLVAVPSFFAAFWWRESTAEGSMWSILIAGALTGALYVSGWNPLGVWPPVWGLITSTVLLIVISKMTETPERAKKFIRTVDEEMEKNGFK